MTASSASTPGRDRLFVPRRLSDGEIAQFLRDGYLVLGRTLSDEALEGMREEVMRVWAGEKRGYDPGGTWLENALLADIHHRSPLVREFYFRGPLVDVAGQLIGPNIKGATAQLTFKMRGNTQSFAWHQDNGYGELDPYNAVSALTALDDCDRANGCLWVIPGSNRGGQMLRLDQEKKEALAEIRMEVDESAAVPVPLAAGESFIMHCWTLHKSGGNFSPDRDRRILFLRYADADAVEVYNGGKPRLGRLLRGTTRFDEVRNFETELEES